MITTADQAWARLCSVNSRDLNITRLICSLVVFHHGFQVIASDIFLGLPRDSLFDLRDPRDPREFDLRKNSQNKTNGKNKENLCN